MWEPGKGKTSKAVVKRVTSSLPEVAEPVF